MPDLFKDHRSSVASHHLVGAEHELVDDELTAPVEDVDQPRLAVPSVEHPVLLEADPRQAATLGGERVSRPGRGFLLRADLLERGLPLLLRHNWRTIHEGGFLLRLPLLRRTATGRS